MGAVHPWVPAGFWSFRSRMKVPGPSKACLAGVWTAVPGVRARVCKLLPGLVLRPSSTGSGVYFLRLWAQKVRLPDRMGVKTPRTDG